MLYLVTFGSMLRHWLRYANAAVRSSKKYYDPGGFETKPSSSARRPQHVANAHLSSSHSLGSEGKRSAFFGNSAMQPYPAKSRGSVTA